MFWINPNPGKIMALGQKLNTLPEIRFAAATPGKSNLVAHQVLPNSCSTTDFIDQALADKALTGVEIQTVGQMFGLRH